MSDPPRRPLVESLADAPTSASPKAARRDPACAVPAGHCLGLPGIALDGKTLRGS